MGSFTIVLFDNMSRGNNLDYLQSQIFIAVRAKER